MVWCAFGVDLVVGQVAARGRFFWRELRRNLELIEGDLMVRDGDEEGWRMRWNRVGSLEIG